MAEQNELREKGLRLTPQRELVLQAVRDLGHATPEEVASISRPFIAISKLLRMLGWYNTPILAMEARPTMPLRS